MCQTQIDGSTASFVEKDFIFLCANETGNEKMSLAEIILMIEKGLCLDEKPPQ